MMEWQNSFIEKGNIESIPHTKNQTKLQMYVRYECKN